ncbi:unnamed protein product [Linum tenue]|uniref:Glycosyltransferase n=1 Tax=Linum tenue TaxID=586396 RepID=A0AAV0JMA1_9ROSI|nr:unnamed protein product [Linum tenue]
MKPRNGDGIGVLMFPWLAHGHIYPFLELAKKLVSRQQQPSFHVYLCSSPVNLASISDIQLKYPAIELVELHLPSLPDLPPNRHTTKGLQTNLLTTLYKALDMASSEFADILARLSPDLLITDFFQPWAPELALSTLKIPTVLFMTNAAFSTALPFTAMKNSGRFDGVFPLPSNYMFDYDTHETPSFKDRVFWSLERSSGMLLVKSFREIEAEHIDRVSEFIGKDVVPVGPLVPDDSDDDDDREESVDKVMKWLNEKDPSTAVVYISFGSESYLSGAEREELGQALLILATKGLNFIWVLRFPEGEEMGPADALPEGFLEAVGERGYVAVGWAPQRRILRHRSVAGFVSHCGWSSVTEGMKYGVPIVAMPLQNDQGTNARLVEEVGVGMKVDRIDRGEVARVIEQVVTGESGNGIRVKARQIRDCLVENGDREIDEAIDRLVHFCNTFSV